MKIYIAGPYSNGDLALNVRKAIEVAEEIVKLGHTPYIPHLTHFWHLISPHPYEFWLKYDEMWLMSCQALYRIEGISPGADREVKLAEALHLPVYRKLGEIVE